MLPATDRATRAAASGDRVRLLYLRDTLVVCGPGQTILNTWRTLDTDRFALTIASTLAPAGAQNALLERARLMHADTQSFDIRSGVDLAGAWRLARILRNGRFDILQTHDAQTRRLGVLAARLAGVAHVTSVEGWIFNTRKERAARWIDQRLIRQADHVIAVSERLKQEVVAAGTPPDRITVLRNAVVLDDHAGRGLGAALRRELRIPADHAVLSIVGRLSEEKGHAVFLEAARLLAARFADVTFLIVGDGPLRARLEAEVAASDLRDRIVFAGYRTDMSAVYDATTIVVSSSFTEGIPYVLLEAFANARPAVATRVGGVPEIITDGVEGWLVDPGRPQDLAERVGAMLQNRATIAEMGRAARRSVERNFDIRRRTRALEAMYEALATHRRAAART